MHFGAVPIAAEQVHRCTLQQVLQVHGAIRCIVQVHQGTSGQAGVPKPAPILFLILRKLSQVISNGTWVRGKEEDASKGAEGKLNL